MIKSSDMILQLNNTSLQGVWRGQGDVQGATMAIMRGNNALFKLTKIIFFEVMINGGQTLIAYVSAMSQDIDMIFLRIKV